MEKHAFLDKTFIPTTSSQGEVTNPDRMKEL